MINVLTTRILFSTLIMNKVIQRGNSKMMKWKKYRNMQKENMGFSSDEKINKGYFEFK